MKKTSKINNTKVYEFNLPAWKSITGKTICLFADECIKFCFANKGTYLYRNVREKYEKNYKLTKQTNFIELIQTEINKKKPNYIRIHSSGDFYSPKYLQKWIKLAVNNPDIIFYGYTKSIPLFKALKFTPGNFVFCYSKGSKVDHLINEKKDKFTQIFKTEEELLQSGFINASDNDLNVLTDNNKIGLIYH
mgnify:CR=1 FL=1